MSEPTNLEKILRDLPPEFLSSIPELLGDAAAVVSDLPVPDKKTGISRDVATAVSLIKQLERTKVSSGLAKWFSETSEYPIEATPKHIAFFAAGKEYPERLFLAANRVGKTICGAYEATVHATGLYPTWWNGKVFDGPTDGWCIGPDARTVRDTIQKELLGGLGEWGTGMIPANCLGQCSSLQGVPGAVDTIRVRHVPTGGWSSIGFKNYKQDIQAFMGTARHWIWPDEECPIEIWNECNIRTATTGGIMFATFTPLQGLTRMVVNFCKNADFLLGARPIAALAADDGVDEAVGSGKKKAVVQAGWDDAPWITEEAKQRLYEDTPLHLRDARSKGIPAMDAGNVYTTPVEQIVVKPFEIPSNWPRMYALDVGWNRTAVLWAALDPNSGTVYFYDEHYQGQQEPYHHAYAIKSRGEKIPGVIDPAARGRSTADGTKLWKIYREHGLTLFLAKNERESGISALAQRFATGKAKVFSTLTNFQKEYMLYRRDLNGRVIDEDDHLMDCARYVINNMNRMASIVKSGPATGINYRPPTYDI